MFSTWLFMPDDRYDRDHASDFQSRYGAYLRQNAGLFVDDEEPTSNRLEFAAAAWRIAQSPVMSPPYVTTHPRVLDAKPAWDYEGRLAIRVQVAAGIPSELARSLRGAWSGWQGDRQWFAPEDNDRPVATAVLEFRVPMSAMGLPAPAYGPLAVPDTETAKDAVGIVCGRLNAALARVFAQLARKEVA